MDWSQLPPYLVGIAGVAGGTVSFLKWRTDTDDQEEKRKNEATRQAFEIYQGTIAQLEKRVDAAEAASVDATRRATLADTRLVELERDNRECERRNVQLQAMLELMRTILNDRGIHIPAFQPNAQSQPDPSGGQAP